MWKQLWGQGRASQTGPTSLTSRRCPPAGRRHPWSPFFTSIQPSAALCQNRPTLLLVKCAIMKGMLEDRVMGFHSSYSKTSVKNTRNQSSHSNTNPTNKHCLTLVIAPKGICAGCILQTEHVRMLRDAIDIIKTSEGEVHRSRLASSLSASTASPVSEVSCFSLKCSNFIIHLALVDIKSLSPE